VDCIPLDPALAETREQLYDRYLRLTQQTVKNTL
jgi:hypothetical protein